jgi:2-polyprenyl-3-methyl-5-hydroxy-6-metoxy-1,4-benzoquinol methylase
MEQINTNEYWDKKWGDRKTGGRYGENQYHFLKDLLPKDEPFTLLDLGCGRGAGVGYLSEIFPKAKITGLDFSQTGIETARKKYHGNNNLGFKCDDVYKFDVLGQYDYIVSVELLEHLRWPEKILDKYIPMTKKAMYISIPWNNWKCDEHIYAYGDYVNPFEKWGAELLGKIDGRKKLKIEVKK